MSISTGFIPQGSPAAGSTESTAISSRKQDHLDIVLTQPVGSKGVTTGFERFFFEHCALPEICLDQVDLGSELWGKSLRAPLLISSMTGGTPAAHQINLHLAEAAQTLGIAMGLGSQRAALEDPSLGWTYQVRQVAPDSVLFANWGAAQLNHSYGVEQARRAVEMIEADGLFLHLNPLQEAVQPQGDRDWRDLYSKIEQLVTQLGLPVVIKEVGNGISGAIARRLADCGVAAVDVAGAGGTSWSEVEAYRQSDPLQRQIAHHFAGWGIPTALCLMEVRQAAPELAVFASGGIRSGVDVAKAIRLGADLVGMAAPGLGRAATAGAEGVIEGLGAVIEELKIAAFCTGSPTLAALKSAPLRWVDSWHLVDTK